MPADSRSACIKMSSCLSVRPRLSALGYYMRGWVHCLEAWAKNLLEKVLQ